MRLIKTALLLLVALVIGVYSFFYLTLCVLSDRTPPVIEFDRPTLEASIDDGFDGLLAGVSATDNVDGDLTDQVMVRSISQFVDDSTVRVSYTVFDSADNQSIVSRNVRYVDYTPPRFSLKAPLLCAANTSVPLSSSLSAFDVKDGDLTSSIRLQKSNVLLSTPGIYQVTVQVSNSLGDLTRLTLPVCIYARQNNIPVLELSDYLVYLPVGSSFAPRDYLSAVYATPADKASDEAGETAAETPADGEQDAQNSLRVPFRYVDIQSDVNTELPGTYTVIYTYTNEQDITGTTLLTVVVTE